MTSYHVGTVEDFYESCFALVKECDIEKSRQLPDTGGLLLSAVRDEFCQVDVLGALAASFNFESRELAAVSALI